MLEARLMNMKRESKKYRVHNIVINPMQMLNSKLALCVNLIFVFTVNIAIHLLHKLNDIKCQQQRDFCTFFSKFPAD